MQPSVGRPGFGSQVRHFRATLLFRLGLVVNLTAVLVLVSFWGLDYWREYRLHVSDVSERLREEANVLRIAQEQMPDTESFDRYLDGYCSQTNSRISPGHHLAVFDSSGRVIARAHRHAAAGLESGMASACKDTVSTFIHDRQKYMAVSVPFALGQTMVVAQAMAPVEEAVREQAISRAISLTVLAVLLMAVINIALMHWVRRPIRDLTQGVEAIRGGRLDHRIPELSTAEFRFLGDGFNRMASELDLAERQREELTQRLLRSNQDLKQFACVASHDLQEPLRTIAGFLKLLNDRYQGKLDERADEYIGLAVDGAVRMKQLIDDLLAYSRVDRCGHEVRPIDATECLATALANLRLAIVESDAVVSYDPLPTVHAEPTRLAQLFQNLIGNAIKFRRQGVRPEVHLGAGVDGDSWVFWVRDNGIGIAPEHHEQVFMIFRRLHGRSEYAGTGVGLAVCQKIVESHGGRIWVESRMGEGATFYFTLPKKALDMCEPKASGPFPNGGVSCS